MTTAEETNKDYRLKEISQEVWDEFQKNQQAEQSEQECRWYGFKIGFALAMFLVFVFMGGPAEPGIW
jgi:hypothetical protein